jgi:hypothetical protein
MAAPARFRFILVLIGVGAALVLGGERARADDTYRVVDVVSPDVLNVRAGPSTSFPVIGTLEPDSGGIHIIGDCRDRWCPVQRGSVMGWASAKFLAVEDEPTQPPAAETNATRTVLPDGTLELRFANGTKRRRLPDGGLEVVRPDGTTSKFAFLQAPGADLPPLPTEYADWGTRLNSDLLSILNNILTPDEMTAYKQTEEGKSFYELTNWRLLSIQFLTAPTS